MESISKLSANIVIHVDAIEYIKDKMCELANEMPDNPKIKRLDQRCFIINMSDISGDLNFDPKYYDFNFQNRIISALIKRSNPANVMKILDEIIKKGRYRVGVIAELPQFGNMGDVKFHEGVVNNLIKIVYPGGNMETRKMLDFILEHVDPKDAVIETLGKQSIKITHKCSCYFVQHAFSWGGNKFTAEKASKMTKERIEKEKDIDIDRGYFVELCPEHEIKFREGK